MKRKRKNNPEENKPLHNLPLFKTVSSENLTIARDEGNADFTVLRFTAKGIRDETVRHNDVLKAILNHARRLDW